MSIEQWFEGLFAVDENDEVHLLVLSTSMS